MLVIGEAGIGKSSPVRTMPDRLPGRAGALVGPRDDLATRRPLGHRVYEASVTPHPAVLVVENVDRADEASLDALRFLVRCMERLPALLVLTCPDDG